MALALATVHMCGRCSGYCTAMKRSTVKATMSHTERKAHTDDTLVSESPNDDKLPSMIYFAEGCVTCYEVLRAAMTQVAGKQSPSGSPFTPVHAFVMNPKSITMGQLYGEFDAVTHEWTDGILPSLVRVGAAQTDADKRWYVFDGPVDAVWIENMNTVLDDNKKLCLTSGEIIKLSEHMTMMFEVADLAVASPATVSRCGMVYLEPSVLGLAPFLDSWLLTLPQHGLDALPSLESDLRAVLADYLVGGVTALRGELAVDEYLESSDICIVQGCLRLLDARLAPLRGPRPPPAAPFLALLPELLVPWVVFAVVWSVGATCDDASRERFSQWVRGTMERRAARPAFPAQGLVYDYRLHDGGFQDATDDGEPAAPHWVHWMQGEEPFVIPKEIRYSGNPPIDSAEWNSLGVLLYSAFFPPVLVDIEVPTLDTRRSAAMLGLLVTQGHNVACVGPTGTGKTLTVVAKLDRGLPDKYIADFLCFSARTSAKQTQDVIDAKLDRRRKGVFGPPPNKRQLLFIDDFNMPALEVYGAQPPIELIRQWLDFQGIPMKKDDTKRAIIALECWYDRKAVGEFRQIVDVNLIVAMGPPGGGRNPVTPRVMRHFHYLSFTELQEDSKMTIFGTITRWWLSRTQTLADEEERLVRASLDVYDVVLRELLPTPTKTHYTFNLRDLSKVFQGVLMADPKNVASLDQLLVLWYHENLRVYQDRLVDDKDRAWFSERLRAVMRTRFNQDPVGEDPLYFGELSNPEREYDRITDVDRLSSVLVELLDEYNSQSIAPMRLVLFTDAVQHVCRIARILRQPQGNALLLGMGGSGRQSLTRLAAFALDLTCFQVVLSRAYGLPEWREDLKHLLLKAGLYMKETVFLFSDTQIKSESFLEDINSVLSSGDVPNIYEAEELDKIYQLMRGVVTEQGLQATRSNMFSAFQRTVKSNLHCIITMSPIGDVFRARLRMFPALVNCCTIDWFSTWPASALKSVATRFLSDIPGIEVSGAVRDGMVAVCQDMHTSVVTASEVFVRVISKVSHSLRTVEALLRDPNLLLGAADELLGTAGLGKLQKTGEEVAELQQDLAAMRPALLKAQQETIGRVERAKQEAEREEKTASEKSAVCAAIAQDAEDDLGAITETVCETVFFEYELSLAYGYEIAMPLAMPALLEAEKSLKALNKNDISEVRALKKPPAGVVLVIEAICIAMGVAPNRVPGEKIGEKVNDFWTPGTALLVNPDHFLNSLVTYDKENMTEDIVKKLKPYIENPQFQPNFVVKVSKACGSLCVWTHAIYKFYFVYQNVRPKKEKLAEANRELDITKQALKATRDRMAEIMAGLEALQQELRVTEEEKAELEARAQLCEDRMDRARRLLGGVASEQGRWVSTVRELESGKEALLGDILVSAGQSSRDKRRPAEANPAPAWLSARAWAELLAMRRLERLREFAESVPKDIDRYKAIFDSPQPHREPLSEPWQSRLDGFQRLLLLRALRPDKLTEGLQDWLSRMLGPRFVEPQATDVATMFKDASAAIPLVFLEDGAMLPDYQTYVRALPINDAPQLFGLHPNADISCAQNTAYAGLGALQSLQPRSAGAGGGGGGGARREEATMEAAAALLKQIPRPMDVKPIMAKWGRGQKKLCPAEQPSPGVIRAKLQKESIMASVPRSVKGKGEIRLLPKIPDREPKLAKDGSSAHLTSVPRVRRYPVTYEESFNTVLVQEVTRFNKLLATVIQSLEDLMRAVRGLVVMSAALEAVADSLAANAVPQLWAAKAYPSLKPLGEPEAASVGRDFKCGTAPILFSLHQKSYTVHTQKVISKQCEVIALHHESV
ncbi:hypothetical protein FOCC_FOCC013411 [Frankliniella occidentalis]|nr:hypothetical protein FOCC_FOCC013411 [Frankliniella occidentalis]